jgi:hypothetical protein
MITKKYTIPKHKKTKVGKYKNVSRISKNKNTRKTNKKNKKYTKKRVIQYAGVPEQNERRQLKLYQNPSSQYLYYKHNPTNKFYGYNPLQLNAAIFQYLVNNSLLQLYSDTENNSNTEKKQYMGFNNFPSIP